ncbi:MAG TPA: DNA-processing protein DprA [Anaerolineae bacterium]|mgnify:CR=1 FL=1|nr:DNA-processing protein DprA [Anaerolineae bacterium]HQH39605.1 DNA-processing protein DprA [Anaerolineae bacterium]
MDDLRYWLGFNLVRGIGPVRLRMLLDTFGDIRSAWEAPEQALREMKLERRSLENFLKIRHQVDLDEVLRRVDGMGIHVLTWDSPDYPDLLKPIADAPPVLFVRGAIIPPDEWAVALVGTRKATVYGREVARVLAADLAQNGVTVVSGLARGVDSVAHRAALDAGGRTCAVLGSGVDCIYPAEHRKLADAIAENGALISDYPLGTQPEAANFPARNRLISGLSLGVVVVEAGLKSGALITADFALDQGREVFAVPGSILSPASAGCNRLLRDGANVVTEVGDILETLHLNQVSEKQMAREVLPTNAMEAALIGHLSAEPRHLDELSRETALPVEVVSSTLVMMELKGMTRQVAPLQYVLAREPAEEYVVDDSTKEAE